MKIIKKIGIEIKEYYTFKRESPRETIIDLSILSISVLFIGLLISLLRDFGKILFLNNFEKSSIDLFVILIGFVIILLLFMITVIEKKHRGLSPYLIGIELILIWIYAPGTTAIKIIIIAVFLVLSAPIIYNELGKLNIWLIIMVILALILLLLGFSYLQNMYGMEKQTISLNSCGGKIKEINMTCRSNKQEHLIAGYLTTCKLNKEFEKLNGLVKFKLYNGTESNSTFDKVIEFIPPDKLKEIRFEINTTSNKNISYCMDTNIIEALNVYSYEELQRRKEKFNDYLIALFGIVVFSVPVVTINLMKIWREGNK